MGEYDLHEDAARTFLDVLVQLCHKQHIERTTAVRTVLFRNPILRQTSVLPVKSVKGFPIMSPRGVVYLPL